ncbi:hypothetical protein KIW84_022841 [Lathyrus oleraceus]|uniref:Uncharacterized protein n=1 Tax=Pisum sativum TaxID=3888 RepID=A0A9D4YFV8_PEA|nr:hypothetical protein KIW84_022841 [Pisum sativum]
MGKLARSLPLHLTTSLFKKNGIDAIVVVTNGEVLRIGESPSAVAAWINKNVVAYVPSTNITAAEKDHFERADAHDLNGNSTAAYECYHKAVDIPYL